MSVKRKYSVKSVDNALVKEWFLKKHYAKRIPNITYCFGLYDESNILTGVCSFGFPLASQLQNAANDKFKVIELNRLVVNGNLPKNTLSYFVSECLKKLPNPVLIVSYADTGQGHHGYIYQATNWIYTGIGGGGWGWAVKGLEHMHHVSIEDSVGRYEDRISDKTLEQLLKEKYGDKLYKIKISAKHRYFMFLGNKQQKKIFWQNFKYRQLPYPKGQNNRYDSSYKPNIQLILF